jgi:hypothetical protein
VLTLTRRDLGFDSVFIEAGSEQLRDPTVGNIGH